jgi:hypothetical protein
MAETDELARLDIEAANQLARHLRTVAAVNPSVCIHGMPPRVALIIARRIEQGAAPPAEPRVIVAEIPVEPEQTRVMLIAFTFMLGSAAYNALYPAGTLLGAYLQGLFQ